MTLREYIPSDCKHLAELFYNTIHTVNAKDYSDEQLNAWATGVVDLDAWNQSLSRNYTVVALEGDTIIGFGDMESTGYLNRLFVHADFQRMGVATAICDALESSVHGRVTTHASITARPFFASRGYVVVKEQRIERRGVYLTNYVMELNR